MSAVLEISNHDICSRIPLFLGIVSVRSIPFSSSPVPTKDQCLNGNLFYEISHHFRTRKTFLAISQVQSMSLNMDMLMTRTESSGLVYELSFLSEARGKIPLQCVLGKHSTRTQMILRESWKYWSCSFHVTMASGCPCILPRHGTESLTT